MHTFTDTDTDNTTAMYTYTTLHTVYLISHIGLVVRLALANNCSTGVNRLQCATPGKANDRAAYAAVLREHAAVFPTGRWVDVMVMIVMLH